MAIDESRLSLRNFTAVDARLLLDGKPVGMTVNGPGPMVRT